MILGEHLEVSRKEKASRFVRCLQEEHDGKKKRPSRCNVGTVADPWLLPGGAQCLNRRWQMRLRAFHSYEAMLF